MDPRIAQAARLHQAGNLSAAEPIYRQVLRNQPRNSDVLTLLGMVLHDTRRFDEAVPLLAQATQIKPDSVDAQRTLTMCLAALGRWAEAAAPAAAVARLQPADLQSQLGLVIVLMHTGQHPAAAQQALRATALGPNLPVVWITLTRALIAAGDYAQARVAVDRALSLDNRSADAWIENAILHNAVGQLNEAVTAYETALRIDPRNIAALNNLGAIFLMQARAGDALRCFEAAAQLAPTTAKPRNNIGALLKEAGRLDEAIPHFQQALQLDPGYGEAANNLGTVYSVLGEHAKALAAYSEALRITPGFAPAFSNLLLLLISMPDVEADEIYQKHREFGRRFADPLPKLPAINVTVQDRDRRLRVGYVSPDFREHSVRYFIEPVLAGHDRSQFQVFCYATGSRSDEATVRLQAMADAWHPVSGLSDPQLAELIRSHRIDILVDLAGHTAENRLLTFARKPAPVQISYLGYPATTGMAAMDYRLSDARVDPPDQDHLHSEKLIRLPDAFFVYTDDPGKPYDPVLPADRAGHFTFGSFNNFTKIHPQLLEAWARILAAVPRSRLLMKTKALDNPSTVNTVRTAFARHGVETARLELLGWVPLPMHFGALSRVDLMLDTYPYNGHTTSCQSLWMGAAVLTRAGQSFRSRVGLTLLRQLGLEELITESGEHYIQRAIDLASNHEYLRRLRPTLRQRLMESPVGNPTTFCRNLEAAYRQAWHNQ